MKKFASLLLAGLLAFSSAAMFSGCGDGEFPVKVANITIDKEPQNIVVLDPNAADIIEEIGYTGKMVGRSDEVDQQSLSVAPSVGSSAQPDVEAIKSYDTNLVFADNTLDDTIKSELEESGIDVIKIDVADTANQLETIYTSVGKILGGNTSGASKAASAYSTLLSDMEAVKEQAASLNTSGALSTVCYLFMDDGNLKMMTSGSYGDMLLGYTGCVNVAVNIEENSVDVNTLKIANPNYVFYSDEATLNAIKADTVLSTLNAIKSNNALMVPLSSMQRQGSTALSTLNTMVGFIYPSLAQATQSVSQSATTAEIAQPGVNEQATQATQATEPASVADEYNIDLEGLSLDYEDDSDDVKAMQQRLYDLGYVDDEDNITGYYGDVSKEAVENFQKNNNIEETGTADNATLVAMFKSDAKKAED